MHRSIWEEAFIPVEPTERSTVKIVDGVAARITEAIGAVAILFCLKQMAPDGVLSMPLDTNWIGWVPLATVAVWLLITQRMRVRIKEDRGEMKAAQARDIECERFPDQSPARQSSVKESLDV
jgi:ATP/ADP translocase